MSLAHARPSLTVRLALGATLALSGALAGNTACRLTPFSDAPVTQPAPQESPVAAQTMSRDEPAPSARGGGPTGNAQPPPSGVNTSGQMVRGESGASPPNASNGNGVNTGNANAGASDVGNSTGSASGNDAPAATSSSGPISSVPQPTLAPTEMLSAGGTGATVVPPTHPGPQPVVAVIDARCLPPSERCGEADASLNAYGWVACVPIAPRCDAATPTQAPSLAPMLQELERAHPGAVTQHGVLLARGVDPGVIAQARAGAPDRWPFVILSAGHNGTVHDNSVATPAEGAAPLRVALVPSTRPSRPLRAWAETLRQQGVGVQWFRPRANPADTTRTALTWILTGQDLSSPASVR